MKRDPIRLSELKVSTARASDLDPDLVAQIGADLRIARQKPADRDSGYDVQAGLARFTALVGKVGPVGGGPGDVGPGNVGPGDVGPNNVGPNNVGPNNVGPNNVGPGSGGPANPASGSGSGATGSAKGLSAKGLSAKGLSAKAAGGVKTAALAKGGLASVLFVGALATAAVYVTSNRDGAAPRDSASTDRTTVAAMPTSMATSTSTSTSTSIATPTSIATSTSTPTATPTSTPSVDSSKTASLKPEMDQLTLLRSTSDPAQALALAEEGHARFPHGVFWQEREVLAIRALSRLGRAPEAAERAKAFVARHPESPYVPELSALAGM